jgi:mycoredoxin
MAKQLAVYGTDWCEDTQRTRHFLDAGGIAYRYINIEEDDAAMQWVLRQNDGTQKTPTVDLGGLVLSVPSDGELETGLRRQGYIPRSIDAADSSSAAQGAGGLP